MGDDKMAIATSGRLNGATAEPRATCPTVSRREIERRLLNNGFDEIVKAKSGLSAREKFVLRLRKPRVMVTVFFAFVVYLAVAAIGAGLSDPRASRLATFLVFDLAAGMGFVLAVAVWLGARRREGPKPARKVALTGAFCVAALAAAPYLIFLALGPGIAPTAAVSGVISVREPAPLNLAIAAAAAFVCGLEAQFNLASRIGSMLRAAWRSVLRTIRDVLWTLPIIVPALFILAFADELWKVVGQLSFGRFLLLDALLLVCIVVFVLSLAREQAGKMLKTGPDGHPARDDELIPAQPDPSGDRHLCPLGEAGIPIRGVERTEAIQKLVTRQWTLQITIRVVLAGLLIALIILAVTALTVTRAVLHEWLAPAKPPDGKNFGPLYLTVKHAQIAIVLGTFATVAFSGLALAEDKVCKRILTPERTRIMQLLTLAGTYATAVEREYWRGTRGETWPSLADFRGDDPDRRNESPRSMGTQWRSADAGSRRRWAAAWNPATGELYAYRSRPPGKVEILAVCKSEQEVNAALAGWRKQEDKKNSLEWLREHARRLPSCATVLATTPADETGRS